jgi:hypothetical protein
MKWQKKRGAVYKMAQTVLKEMDASEEAPKTLR